LIDHKPKYRYGRSGRIGIEPNKEFWRYIPQLLLYGHMIEADLRNYFSYIEDFGLDFVYMMFDVYHYCIFTRDITERRTVGQKASSVIIDSLFDMSRWASSIKAFGVGRY